MRLEGRKVAVVSAHPDDEVIGCAARLPHWDAKIVHTTDGAPRNSHDAAAAGFATREDYARARRDELLAALALVGLGEDRTFQLELVDQEASFFLELMARELAEILADLAPEMVATHAYEGGHPDHDATAFGVHAAMELLLRQGQPVPEVIEFCTYHDKDGAMAVSEFLPADTEIATYVLSPAERRLKKRMLDCFVTQRNVLRAFPIEVERFRAAPRYSFGAPPHPGTLYYERFDWGMTGGRWRHLAAAAWKALGLEREAWGSAS
jgi:N-acetylglucosamine malate deacetylase 2